MDLHLQQQDRREATLRGGDIGWNNVQPVEDGHVEGLLLGPEESAWLQACWDAANGR